jgi:hypothetical protein
MDTVDLPVVDQNDRLMNALRRLVDAGVGACVAVTSAGESIYTADLLTRTLRSRGNISLAALAGKEAVPVTERARDMIESILTHTRAEFGILDIGENTACVVPRSSDQAETLRTSVRICTCASNNNHVYVEAYLRGRKTCELDGSRQDCASTRARTRVATTSYNGAPVISVILQ